MIPSTAHFIWLGTTFPWLNALAVVSASKAGGFERVVLHCDSDLSQTPYWPALARLPGFEARAVDVAQLAAASGVPAGALEALYGAQKRAAARKDVLEAAILVAEGGVYLDLDTVTVRPIDAELLGAGAFCGEERICFPEWSARTPPLGEQLRAWGLTSLRFALRLLPRGFVPFRRIEQWYGLQVNNAVVAAEPGHPFARAFLRAMLDLPLEQAVRPYAVGPDLLAVTLRAARTPDVRVLPPGWFYPLAPEISEHWWSRVDDPDAHLREILRDARVVHWYASVRNRRLAGLVDPSYVRARQHRQLFSALAARFLPEFDA